jgi:hypothetical protein
MMGAVFSINREKTHYHGVPSEESPFHDGEKLIVERDDTRSLRRYLIAILISILALFVVIFAGLLGKRISEVDDHGETWVSCGNSSAEAIENGCHFDPMLISWVPEACYFKEPGDEYDVGDFDWYLDENKSHPVSVEDINSGHYTHVFTDGSHHDQHCIYTWRKMSIALMKRLPLLDSKTADFHHSTHCAQSVRGIVKESKQGISTYSKFYSSVPLLFADCVPLF